MFHAFIILYLIKRRIFVTYKKTKRNTKILWRIIQFKIAFKDFSLSLILTHLLCSVKAFELFFFITDSTWYKKYIIDNSTKVQCEIKAESILKANIWVSNNNFHSTRKQNESEGKTFFFAFWLCYYYVTKTAQGEEEEEKFL